MEGVVAQRTTIGIVDDIEKNGVVFVHELGTNKLGFIDNNTPVTGAVRLKRGVRLSIDVEDRNNIMIVAAARAA